VLAEHTPTYTTGRREAQAGALHPEEEKIQNVGAEFHVTKRGGQVTFHGPGQLVGYPLIDLQRSEVSLLHVGILPFGLLTGPHLA
jgi:lipoate-protein ligase B